MKANDSASRTKRTEEKQSAKQREVARHLLAVLAELGFARLNLREVAARSGTSLGIIHYYFKDKNALLIYSLQLYKEGFASELEGMISAAPSTEQLLTTTAAALSRVVEDPGHTHRLWFDLRTQALFDPAFRPVSDEIESDLIGLTGRFLDKLKRLGGRPTALDAESLYLTIDGLTRYYLQQHLAGSTGAGKRLSERLFHMFGRDDPSAG